MTTRTTNPPPLVLHYPEGDAGVPYMLAIMRASADRLAQVAAGNIDTVLTNPPRRNAPRELAAQIFDAMRARYWFAADPSTADLQRNHAAQLAAMAAGKLAAGDCNNASTIIAAMLARHGHAYRFAAIALPGAPLSHVCACVLLDDGEPYPIDPQEAAAPGSWPPGIGRIALEKPDTTTPAPELYR